MSPGTPLSGGSVGPNSPLRVGYYLATRLGDAELRMRRRPGRLLGRQRLVAWCERDRVADDGEVRARLAAWVPEYAPPAGQFGLWSM